MTKELISVINKLESLNTDLKSGNKPKLNREFFIEFDSLIYDLMVIEQRIELE